MTQFTSENPYRSPEITHPDVRCPHCDCELTANLRKDCTEYRTDDVTPYVMNGDLHFDYDSGDTYDTKTNYFFCASCDHQFTKQKLKELYLQPSKGFKHPLIKRK